MDSLAEDDPTLPVNFGESINFSQLPNVTAGADITAANFSDHFPDTSAPAIQKVGGSGRMSPVRAHTMKEYEQQISDLKKENFSLKLRIYFMEERMQQKFEDNDDITTNIELKVEVESLKKELTEKQQLLVKASNAVESLAHEKDIIAEKMKEEKDDALSQLKEQLEGKCRRIQQELDELQQANQGLQKQLNNASSTKENLEGDLHTKKLASQRQHMDNKEILAEKDRVIEQLNSALRAKDQIIGKLNDEKVLTARKTVQPLQEEVNKLKEQLQEKEDQIEDIEKDAGRGKDRDKERIRKQYEDVYLEQEKRVRELEDATEQLQDEINNKTKNIKDIGNALKVSQKVIKELDRKVKDKDAEIEALESGGKKETKANQGLTEMVKAKDKEIQQLCDQIEDMEEALTRANERVNKAERKKHEGMEQQQSSLSELEERLADMRSQLHTKDLDNERLQRSMTRKQHEIDRLKDEMTETEDQTDGMAKQKDDTIKLLKDQLQDSKVKSKENADAIEQHYQNLLDDSQHQLDLKEKCIQRLTKGLQEKDRLVKEYMELAKNASLPDAQQASTESILQDLRDKLADRDKALQEANDEKIKAVDAKEAELRALKHSLRDHQRDLERANGDMMEDANRLGELESKMKDLDNKNKQLSDSVKALNKANHDAEDNHHRSLGEKDAIISRLQAAIAGKERELEEERDAQQKNRERNGAAQNVAIQQLNERLRDKDKQLEEIVCERAQVAAANEKATQDLLQTIRDKDTHIKDLNDRYNRALVDKSNALRDLQRQVNEKEYELQNAEETLARADHEQGALLGKMRNALSEKDKTIEKLLESGREKDRLFLEMQQSAVRASPSPSHNAEMTRLKDENDRLNREIDKLTDLVGRLRSQKPDEDYVTSLKDDLDNKNKLLAKAKESLESLQDEQEADRLAKQNAAKLRRKILDLEDELQAKQDRIDELNNAGRIKDSLIKELKLEISRLNGDQSPRGSDSSEQLQQLMQEQIRELSRLTSALHANLPLNVNITHQSETASTRGASHDDGDRNSLRDVLGAMQTLRRQIEDGMGRRNDNHLHVVIDRQGAVQSSTTSGVGSGVGSDSNDISPTITTASESQRRSFGVGHDPESMQPPPLFSQDTGLYIPVPQPSLSLEELSYPTAATKEELQREVMELRSQLKDSKQRQQTLEKRLEREELESLRSIPGHDLTDPTAATREELQREVADLRSKLKDARRRYQSLEKRIEREELESLRSVPGQETDGDPQVISGLQKDLAGLRKKLRESERHNTTLKQQLDAALLNQASSDSSGDHVVPILKQQLDQAKALLEEENHKLQAAEQQNAALRHHLGIGPESPPDSGRDLVDNLKLENEHLASQLQEAVERAQGRQQDTQNRYGQTAGSSADGVQVALLQKKLDKAQNLIELLKRHIRLNGSGADGQEREFNPELIVDMAKEIERLRKELDSARDQEQVTNDETDNTRKTRPARRASSSNEVVMPPSLHKQLEKAQLEMNATKRRFKALTLKLHATEGTVHQQAERIKRYRRQLHNMGLPAPGTPKRVSSDSNLLNASTYAQANRRLSAVSLSQIPSSDDDRDSTSSASLTPSERSVGAADVTFSGFGLTNDTDELKEQVAVLKKQLKRCRHVIRKLQVRIQNGGLSRPSSPSRDPSNPNPWFELVVNRAAFERLQQDLENVTSQLEKVMDANASLQERNQELLSELVELQTQKQNSFSEEVIRSQELEIGRLHEQLAELRSLMAVLTNMLAEALGILKGLEKDNKTAMEGAYSERVTVIEERLRDGTEVVDTIKRLIGDESQFGRRQSEDDVRELFSDRLRVKDEQMQQLRDEIRGQQKLNRELQEILHNNQLKADSMKNELKRLRSEQTRETKIQEDLESQRKQNQDMQEILRKQEQRAEAARKDLEREYEKEIIILHDRLEEARKMNDKHGEKRKKTAGSEHSDGQGTIYLHETNIKLTNENSVLQKRLTEQEDKAYRVKAELDRANKEIKRLLSEKHRMSDQTQRLQDQVTDNEQLANSLRFELSIYEQLHQKENSSRSPGSRGRGGEHSPSHPSPSRLHVIDRTTGVDLSELLQELRHLRIQLERSIDTNNALRIRLEEALREKTLSPSSGKASSSPRTTVISEEVRIHSSSSSTRRRSTEDRTKSNSARKLFTDGKTQKHHEGNGHLDEDFAIDGIGHFYSNGDSRLRKSSSVQSEISEGGSKKESYAVSMATTYEAVRSGVKEAAVVGGTIEVLLREKLSRLAQVVEESSPHSRGDLGEVESGDHTLLTTLAHDVRRLMKLLDTSRRHLVNFWMTDRLVQQHSQSDEVKELRKRLGAQDRLMKEARDRLAATNREKESMEDAIIRQLCKTHNVIQKAKGNLQTVQA